MTAAAVSRRPSETAVTMTKLYAAAVAVDNTHAATTAASTFKHNTKTQAGGWL